MAANQVPQPPVYTPTPSMVSVSENGLPDMTGFEPDELGVPLNSWLSPNYLLADRGLEAGEKLHAWLIRRSDGYPLEHVEFTADTGSLPKAKWPQAFAKNINKNARQITAGGWTKEGEFTDLPGSATAKEFALLNIVGKASINQLWHYSRDNRTFSTAAFNNNWVATLTLGQVALDAQATLWVQVRDITSQYLHKTHIFQPEAARLSAEQWPKTLCEQLNRDGKMLRAGVLNAETALIKPAATGNALWIPQGSDLAVTVMPVVWWTRRTVQAERDLAEGESIYCYVWDDFSDIELVAPHCFTPANAQERKKENWVSAWALALKSSALSSYVRLGTGTQGLTAPTANAAAALWQVGAAVRVFTTEPSDQNWETVSVPLEAMYTNSSSSVQLQLSHEFTGKPFYTINSQPNVAEALPTGNGWWNNSILFLNAQLKNDPRPYIRLPTTPTATSCSVCVPVLSSIRATIKSAPPVDPGIVSTISIIQQLRKLHEEEELAKTVTPNPAPDTAIKAHREKCNKILSGNTAAQMYNFSGLFSLNS